MIPAALKVISVLRWLFGDEQVAHMLKWTIGIALAIVVGTFLTATWALGIMAQPGGMYWLAAAGSRGGGLAELDPAPLPVPPGPGGQRPAAPQVVAPGPGIGNRIIVPSGTDLPGPPNAAAIIATAQSWLGVPYLWGGCGRGGIDCSCFVMNVLRAHGYMPPRTTSWQITWGSPVSGPLRPTDLVFFDNTCTDCGPNPTHVGLYLGDGWMIQAGGASVSIQPVFSGWYATAPRRFAGARRLP